MLARIGERRLVGVVLVVFMAVFTAMRLYSYTQKSATYDEPLHLTAGYAALSAGDFRVDPTHPPFLRMWAALPLLFGGAPPIDVRPIDRDVPEKWLDRGFNFARAYLYGTGRADDLLYRARFMTVLLALLLGILVFAWVRDILGLTPAVLALAFYTVSPNLTAHASLVTTDLGITCFAFAAVYALWRHLQRPTRLNRAMLLVSVSLAVISKFSGVLVPVVVVLLLMFAVFRRAITPSRAVRAAASMAFSIYVAIWAVYGFRYTPGSSADWVFHAERHEAVRADDSLTQRALLWVDQQHLLPNAFAQGLIVSTVSARARPSFLAGEYSTSGWWWYFPFAFVVKTPVPQLALLGWGLAVFALRRTKGRISPAFLLVPIAVFFAAAMMSAINLGLRHLLPILPFVLIIVAVAATHLLSAGRAARVSLALLVAFWVVQFGSVYPNSLTFFNLLAGGPVHGASLLTDSNIDWGQHLKQLKKWMDKEGVTHVNLGYFGSADPSYYRIAHTPLPSTLSVDGAPPKLPGYVAVSATTQAGVYLPPEWRLFYRALRGVTPTARIGNSINVYWLNAWPEPPVSDRDDPEAIRALADRFNEWQWRDRAIAAYRAYRSRRPGDARACHALTVTLLQSSQLAQAETEARQCVTIAPNDGVSYDLLGRALASLGRWEEALAVLREGIKVDPTLEPLQRTLQLVENRGVSRSVVP
jgi:4-amino-4-deoxy-L-arabinose transferase-like glycosyltransferase